MRRQAIAHIVSLALLRIGLSFLLAHLGLAAISDDDYSRVVIAQLFADHPRLDPSGTSWLPFPFWCLGLPMLLLGHSLWIARALSTALSCLCAVLLYLLAKRSGLAPRTAFFGAILATLSPLSAILGSCTVPEWPTAVFCAGALLLLRNVSSANLALASALSIAACLSRYDVWPVSFVLAASVWLVAREKGSSPLSTFHRSIFSLLFLIGPLMWISWNAYSHADPLHFLSRVASYRSALGIAASFKSLSTYPLALLQADPLLLIAFCVSLGVAWTCRSRLRCWLVPLLGLLALVVGLMLAEARGAAPTHHPERALLTVVIVGWMIVSELLCVRLDTNALRRSIINVAVTTGSLAIVIYTAKIAPSYGADRRSEELIGTWLSRHVAPSETVVVLPRDYGYFAMSAAFGDPKRLSVTRTLDPREKKSSIDQIEELTQFVVLKRAAWVVVLSENATPMLSLQEQTRIGDWTISRVLTP